MMQGGSLWAGLLTGGFSQFQDTKKLSEGQMNKSDYAVKTTSNVTSAIGVMAGVEYGAMLGTSIMPGVGTVVGSIVGGFLGDRVGRTVGMQAGDMLVNNRMMLPFTAQTAQTAVSNNDNAQAESLAH